MSKEYEIWMEGFASSDGHAGASYCGKFEGETFMDAYLAMVKHKYGDDRPSYVRMNEPVIWGCWCYDNESDARKSFG